MQFSRLGADLRKQQELNHSKISSYTVFILSVNIIKYYMLVISRACILSRCGINICILQNVHIILTFLYTNTAATAVDRAGYGQGTGLPIVLDDLACSSTESRLIDCRGRQGSHNCNHREDAGVICVPPYTPGPGSYSYCPVH